MATWSPDDERALTLVTLARVRRRRHNVLRWALAHMVASYGCFGAVAAVDVYRYGELQPERIKALASAPLRAIALPLLCLAMLMPVDRPSAGVVAGVWTAYLSIFIAMNHLLRWRDDRAERRRLQGLCPLCGYDLRASQGRCPERGRPFP